MTAKKLRYERVGLRLESRKAYAKCLGKNPHPTAAQLCGRRWHQEPNFGWVARIAGGRYCERLMIPAYDRGLRGTHSLGLILIVVVALTEAIAP